MDEAIAASRQAPLAAAVTRGPSAVAAASARLIQLLPAARRPGKGRRLIDMTYNLPLVVAPLAAGVVLGLMNSNPALFALACLVTILAAVTVSRVRSVS